MAKSMPTESSPVLPQKLLDLFAEPPETLLGVWQVLESDELHRIVSYCLQTGGKGQFSGLVELAARSLRFRPKTLWGKPLPTLVDLLLQRGFAEEYAEELLGFWSSSSCSDLIDHFFEGVEPDEDSETLEQGRYFPFEPERIPSAAKRLFALRDPETVAITTLCLHNFEKKMRPGLEVFFGEVLSNELEEVIRESTSMWEEWVAEHPEEAIEANGMEPETIDYSHIAALGDAERELHSFQNRFETIGAGLAVALEAVENLEVPADLTSAADLLLLSTQLPPLIARCMELAAAAGVDLPPPEASRRSLTELQEIITAWKDAVEDRSRADEALQVLRAAKQIRHIDDSFEALVQVRASADSLISKIETGEETGDEELEGISAGTHPLARLLAAVRDRPKLEGKAVAQLGEDISHLFSPALGIAIVLNQLKETSDGVENGTAEGMKEDPETDGEPSADIPASEGKNPEALTDTEDTRGPTPGEESPEPVSGKHGGDTSPHGEGSHDLHEALKEVEEEAPGLEGATQNGTEPLTDGDMDAPSIADLVSARRELARTDLGQTLLAKLVERGDSALACHLSASFSNSADRKAQIPTWLLEALTLAPHVTTPMGELYHPFRDKLAFFEAGVLETGFDEWDQGLGLLIAAATLRPSLLVPTTLAPHVLAQVCFREGLNNLWSYCQFIAENTASGAAIDPVILRRVQGQAVWEEQVEELRERTDQWARSSPRATLAYAAGTNVWQAWHKAGGPIHELLEPVRKGEFDQVEHVRRLISKLSDPQQFRKLVNDTDTKVLRRRRGDPIIAKASRQLQSKTREALDLARTWVGLADAEPGESHTYRIEHLDRIRRESISRHGQIREEIDSLLDAGPTPIVSAGLKSVQAAIDDMEAMFDPAFPFSSEEPSAPFVVNHHLLKTNGITLSEDWIIDPLTEEEITSEVLALVLQNPMPGWVEAFKYRMELGDHVGTDLLLWLIGQEEGDQSEQRAADGRRDRDKRIDEAHTEVMALLRAAQTDVDRAVMHGLLSERERAALIDRTTLVEQALPRSLSFHLLRKELSAVTTEIADLRIKQVVEVKDKIRKVGVEAGTPEHTRILEVLSQGDVLTANEFLHHFERGLDLPPPEQPPSSQFDRFFPKSVQELESWGSPNQAQIVQSFRRREDIPGVTASTLDEFQAERAADALETWYRAHRKAGSPDFKSIEAIFSFLGFYVLGVKEAGVETKGPNRKWLEVLTEPVRDRARCPVTVFGSSAAGDSANARARYRVLCVWNEPTPEDLLALVGTRPQESPVFVLYFGKLLEAARRSLARVSRERENRRTFLVIDDFLMLFLAGEPQARMAAMFACTLPFTFLEPYVTTAGVVPPEVFFGREAERESVADPHGSCFIYGGRQLGKTALLRHVERRFHDPDNSRLARYFDLKSSGVGFDRPVDDFWQIVAEDLKAFGLISTQVPVHASPDKILGEVKSWLDEVEDRRILLLLDEADRFLEADRDFTRVARLKGLMDATQRRFKVVFAGLHNVQRSIRLSNNPLAHLGEPLCIGPLFENGEWRQARALIERPLHALGYRFESPDLVTRILSQTNYYPSLLQLYGTALLRDVSRSGVEAFDYRKCPPFVLTEKHVENAYQSKELWQWIRERFRWTLDLDDRYRLIAYLIAWKVLLDGDTTARGFKSREVREQALSWWPQGFAEDDSEGTFRVLLEEMVGLGILRQAEEGRYTLRSANVGLLIGSLDEIEDALVDLSEKEPSPGYEPSIFRRPLPSKGGREEVRLSPLTAQQESALQDRSHGVSIIFGSKAAGLPDLYQVFPKVFGEEYLIILSGLSERDQFGNHLSQLKGRRSDGVTLMVLDDTCAWEPTWIKDALKKTKSFKSKDAFVRVAFVGNPTHTWNLFPEVEGSDEWMGGELPSLSLRPWHDIALRGWLDELKVPSNLLDRNMAKVKELTGKWPALLYELAPDLQAAPAAKWEPVFRAFEKTWKDDPTVTASRIKTFGLNQSHDTCRVLQVLEELESASESDLAELAELEETRVRRILSWGESLAFVFRTGNALWAIDPIIGRLLSNWTPDES